MKITFFRLKKKKFGVSTKGGYHWATRPLISKMHLNIKKSKFFIYIFFISLKSSIRMWNE